MTEHKFTDDEVRRMLEAIGDVGDCSRDCIFYNGKVHSCGGTVAQHALDLINRQKAEIERLNKKYELAVAEREANVKGFTDVIATAKSEAVKEFADSIKTYYDHIDKTVGALINYTIDKKLEEFLGGDVCETSTETER